MNELSQVFKALSEPLRLRILRRLLTNGREAYGEELAEALGIPAYRLSRHLKVLISTGLVTERREGRWVYYSLAKNHGNGHVLASLRRLLANARPPVEPRRLRRSGATSRAKRGTNGRTAMHPYEASDFNWNEGPAIPGML